MAEELSKIPWIFDPIDMEYALRDAELASETKNQLLAAAFETVAAVHAAISEGAGKTAGILSAANRAD